MTRREVGREEKEEGAERREMAVTSKPAVRRARVMGVPKLPLAFCKGRGG